MFLVHYTQHGDRWDLLAWRYYGEALEYERIIAANPELPITPELDAGVSVLIPVLAPTALPTPQTERPPWLT